MEQAKIINLNSKQQKAALTSTAVINGLPKRFENASFDSFDEHVLSPRIKNLVRRCKEWNGSEGAVLTGGVGIGKTHLAVAMMKNMPMKEVNLAYGEREKERMEFWLAALKKDKENADEEDLEYYDRNIKTATDCLDNKLYAYRPAKCLFIPIISMLLKLNTAKPEEKDKAFEEYTTNKYDCICFDDFGTERLTEAAMQNLFFIINARYNDMLPTIVTSNLSMDEIEQREQRIASRLSEMGILLGFEGEDAVDYRKIKPQVNK